MATTVFKFRINLFNSFTGECVNSFETDPLCMPEQHKVIEKYMEAYWRRLQRDPDSELGMSISSERMVNMTPRTYKVKGRYDEAAIPFEIEDLKSVVADYK